MGGHKARRAATVPLLISAMAMSACLTSTQATRLQTDLDDVKRQVFQVQQDTAGSRTRLEEIDKKLAPRDDSASAAQQADLQTSIRALLDRVQALSQRTEEIWNRLASLGTEMQSPQDQRRRGGASPLEVPSPAAGSGPASAAPPSDTEAEAAFRIAYADYTKGNFELALTGFTEFLHTSPKHALSPDAQYWIGECLYSQGKYKEAADAFDRCVSRQPNGDRVPAALLKKGLAQIESGQTAPGVSTLQKLIEKEPQSDEARLAAERLKQLGLRVH
jgi:tol-pal system protein YbgF